MTPEQFEVLAMKALRLVATLARGREHALLVNSYGKPEHAAGVVRRVYGPIKGAHDRPVAGDDAVEKDRIGGLPS